MFTRHSLAPLARLFLVALVVFPLALSPAFAAKKGKDKGKNNGKDKIEMTDLQSFDKTFKKVKKIDKTVSGSEKEMKTARKDLNTALGIKNGTPLDKAIKELSDRADGKINVAMNGKTPKLETSDAVPSDVDKSIDAVNGFTGAFVISLEEMATLPEETDQLIKKTKKMPEDLKSEMLDEGNFLDVIFKAPKTLKVLQTNIEITAGLPKRTFDVATDMADVLDLVVTEFGGEIPGGGFLPPGLSK